MRQYLKEYLTATFSNYVDSPKRNSGGKGQLKNLNVGEKIHVQYLLPTMDYGRYDLTIIELGPYKKPTQVELIGRTPAGHKFHCYLNPKTRKGGVAFNDVNALQIPEFR